MPQLFDIHSHINFPEFDADRPKLIQEMRSQGVWTITVGTDYASSVEAVHLSEAHEGLFACIGLHPVDNSAELFDAAAYDTLIASPKVVAIGECGLDYFRLKSGTDDEKQRQKRVFEDQIELALSHDLPLMIHCRDAYPDTLDILKSKKREHPRLRGNFHFFTSPVGVARQCLELGFTVSFTGPITYTSDYDEVVAYVPLESMMTETDAPFAAPVPYRGTRNSPLYVGEVVKKIAQVKGRPVDEIRKIMVENALRSFIKQP